MAGDQGDVLVVGPGWLGAPAATALAASGRFARVWTVSRSAQSAPAGCLALQADIRRGPDDDAIAAHVSAPLAAIVVCVAPSRERGDSYAIYPEAARGVAALAQRLGASAVVYVSSTGVYDRQDGNLVDERTLIAPSSERVHALFDAELTVLATASSARRAIVLRAAGLYGPGRDPGPRFASGSTAADTWCNFSWRDDVVSAIGHVLDRPAVGHGEIFNCTDNHPVRAGEITRALTGALPDAPTGTATATDAPVRAGRSNQRISSAALIATGWTPSVPTIFDGLRRLGHALPGLAGDVR